MAEYRSTAYGPKLPSVSSSLGGSPQATVKRCQPRRRRAPVCLRCFGPSASWPPLRPLFPSPAFLPPRASLGRRSALLREVRQALAQRLWGVPGGPVSHRAVLVLYWVAIVPLFWPHLGAFRGRGG